MKPTCTQTMVALAAGLAISASAMGQLTSYTGNDPIGLWNDVNNWSAGVPLAPSSVAFIGTSVNAENTALWLQGETKIGGLIMSDGMLVLNQGNFLGVYSYAANELTTISGSNLVGNVERPTRLRLTPANAYAGIFWGVNIEKGAAFELANGAQALSMDVFNIDEQSTFEGAGLLRVDGPVNGLSNGGTIRSIGGGSLTVTAPISATCDVDLDGPNDTGVLDAMAPDSELLFLVDRAGSFDGEMHIGEGSRIFFNNHSASTLWLQLGYTGPCLITLDGLPGSRAVLESEYGFSLSEVDLEVPGAGYVYGDVRTGDKTDITIHDGGSLHLWGPTEFAGGDVIVGNGGFLNLKGALADSSSTTFTLDGGTVTGGTINGPVIINDDPQGIRGHGFFNTGVRNDTHISADGGILTVRADNNNHDWDGLNNTGSLNAMDGDLHLIDSEPFMFEGDIVVGNGHSFFIDGFIMTMVAGSNTQMVGGSIESNRPLSIHGDLQVLANSSFESSVSIASPAVVDLFANLRLNSGLNFITSGTNISGAGTLIVGSGADLLTGELLVIDADFNNEGVLTLLPDDPGLLNIKRDAMTSGYIRFTLEGTNFGDYDKLIVDQTLTVRNGVFNVYLEEGYMPKSGDEFDIVDFATFVNAGYTLNLATLKLGLLWDTTDFGTDGIVRVITDPDYCYADCDQSTGAGVLDIFDFLCFQDAFVSGKSYACDCDTSTGQGVCDIFDFLCFQDAFVKGCP